MVPVELQIGYVLLLRVMVDATFPYLPPVDAPFAVEDRPSHVVRTTVTDDAVFIGIWYETNHNCGLDVGFWKYRLLVPETVIQFVKF